MKDSLASLFLSAIVGLVAIALLTNNRADAPIEFRVEVGMAQATAVPPTPAPQPTPTPTAWATAVVPIAPPAQAISVEPMSRAEMYEQTGYWLYATPYQLHGDTLTYCHNPAHQWTAEERAITAAGFEAWTPAGLSFHEVAYSLYPPDCLIVVSAGADYGDASLGRALTATNAPVLQSRIFSNLAHAPHSLDVVIHEVGHVLGLGHTQGGVMNEYIIIGARPGAADFHNVRAYWFGEE